MATVQTLDRCGGRSTPKVKAVFDDIRETRKVGLRQRGLANQAEVLERACNTLKYFRQKGPGLLSN